MSLLGCLGKQLLLTINFLCVIFKNKFIYIEGLTKVAKLNSRIFCISLILLICLGVFTTGVAQVCWCQENCMCCRLHGLQYETTSYEESTCHRCCWAAGRIPCNLNKINDMAGSSDNDHREKGSNTSVDNLVFLSDHHFDNHPFAYFARTPYSTSTTKPLAIHLQNQSLLL